jgi:hypothetical protein
MLDSLACLPYISERKILQLVYTDLSLVFYWTRRIDNWLMIQNNLCCLFSLSLSLFLLFWFSLTFGVGVFYYL